MFREHRLRLVSMSPSSSIVSVVLWQGLSSYFSFSPFFIIIIIIVQFYLWLYMCCSSIFFFFQYCYFCNKFYNWFYNAPFETKNPGVFSGGGWIRLLICWQYFILMNFDGVYPSKRKLCSCYVLTFDPAQRNAIPRWCTGRKWHIPMVSNQKRSRGRIKAYNMGQGEGPTVPIQTDAPEESDLWTAWQLFPLDDD